MAETNTAFQGCTHSSQRSPLASPRPSQDITSTRYPSASSAGNTYRPNAPLRLPHTCPRGPNTPRSRRDLERERQAFFDTRVTGRPEIWQAIQLAVSLVREQQDLATAQGILDASGITVPRGRLEEGVWDEQGHLYRLEDWVIADPSDLVDEEKEMDSLDTKDAFREVPEATSPIPAETMLKVRCRFSDRGTDIVVSIGKTQKVKKLGDQIQMESEVRFTSNWSVLERDV